MLEYDCGVKKTLLEVKSSAWPASRWAVAAMFLVNGALLATWVSRLPALKEKLGLDDGGLGLTLLASPIGALLAFPLAGALLARLGSKLVTIGSALLCAVFVALIGLPSSQGALMGVLLLWGMVNATMDVVMNANGTALERVLNRPILSNLHACWSVGNLLAALVAGWVISSGLSLQVHLWGVAGVLSLLAILAGIFMYRSEPSGSSGPIFVLPKGVVWGLGALIFCAFLAEGALSDWGSVYLKDNLKVGESTAAFGYAFYTGSMVLGRFLGDELALRLGEKRLLSYGGILAALGLLVSLSSLSPWLTTLGFGLVGFGIAGAAPVIFRAATRVPGQNADLALTAVATLGYTAFLLGPAIIGGLASLTGLRWALGAVFILLVCIPLISSRLVLNEKK